MADLRELAKLALVAMRAGEAEPQRIFLRTLARRAWHTEAGGPLANLIEGIVKKDTLLEEMSAAGYDLVTSTAKFAALAPSDTEIQEAARIMAEMPEPSAASR